jgi:CRP/FNR family transcriptional regulator, cyclic AMP receptor protein
MTDYWHLRNINWVTRLPQHELERMRRASRVETYRPGESIFGPSARPEYVYLVEDGLVRIYLSPPGAGEFTLAYVRPGEAFGEVAVIAEQPRRSFARARKPSRIRLIPRDEFVRALRSSSSALYELTKKMGRELITCFGRAEDLVFRSVPSRLARLLLRMAEEHGAKGQALQSVGISLTQDEIAMLIGASRQTVSAALRELVDAGLLARHGRRLSLVDVRGLRRLAELPPAD